MEELVKDIYYRQGIEIIMKRYPCVSPGKLDLETIAKHFNKGRLPKFVIDLIGAIRSPEEHKLITEFGYSRVLVLLFYELIDYLSTYHRERCREIVKYLQEEGVSLESYGKDYGEDPVKIVARLLMLPSELEALERAKKGLRATKEECAPYEDETPLDTLRREIEEGAKKVARTWQMRE
jgi:hypothetical protein